ncbi:MAG: DUF5686 family protein [Ferruginibacter sp.]
MLRHLSFFLSFLLLPFMIHAQSVRFTGIVYDSATKAPLAFVSVGVIGTKKGAVTDIDGRFSFSELPSKPVLLFSYIGYRSRQVAIGDASQQSIALEPAGKQLETVVITSGENPAHRIIRLMQQHKKENDPEQNPTFKYNAYTMAALAAGNHFWNMNRMDTSKAKSKGLKIVTKNKDSSGNKMDAELAKRFRENYLMLTESYTERIFRFPKQSKETVLATKISGLKTASFAITASNFQPFGFYRDYLVMNENAFVSPVINGSTGMYQFKLTDVIPHETDTSFIISFQPKQGKNFNGLKGIIHINSDGYAIENVIASPADETGMIFTFRIQQKYNKITGHWFPEQLNSTLTQKDLNSDSVMLFWDSKCYISNVEIGTPITRKLFSDVELEYHPLAGRRSDTAWTHMRADTLTEKEKITYETYDMLPPKYKNTIEKANKAIQILSIEGIPWGNVDIPFKYILSGINKYETFRLGAGLRTNPGFSRLITLSGFGGYGLRDKAFKYGSGLLLNFDERTGTSVSINYARDITEPGNVDYFVRNGSVFSNQTLRNFQTSRMDSVEQVRIELNTRIRPSIQLNTWWLHEDRSPAGYPYEFKDDVNKINYRRFINAELGIGFRLTRGESFVRMGRAKIRNKPPTTQFLVQLSRGMKEWSGDLNYTKAALQLNHSFRLKKLGFTSFQVEAGQVWGDVPYSYLFNAKASRSENKISVHIPNTFQTVRLYEFASDRMASLFIQHNFGNLLFKPSNILIRPEFLVVQNITYGSLQNRIVHHNLDATVPEKGLFESGLLVKNLYRKSILSLFYVGVGGGVFYRYGSYALPKAIDNWVFKWGFDLSF